MRAAAGQGRSFSSTASASAFIARIHRAQTAVITPIRSRLLARLGKNARLMPIKNRITYTMALKARFTACSQRTGQQIADNQRDENEQQTGIHEQTTSL